MEIKKIKKICYVIGSLERGGAEVHLTRILPLIDRSKFEVSVFCFIRKGALAPLLEEQEIKVYEPFFALKASKKSIVLKIILMLFSAISFLKHIYKINPDLVHFFLPASYLFLGPLSLLHRNSIKMMSRRSRNLYQKKYPFFIRSIEIWLHKKMTCILGNSKKVISDLQKEGVSGDKLRLIYNGIEPGSVNSVCPHEFRSSLGARPKEVLITIVANLIPYKGHDDLIKACALLKAKNWKLLIVGNDAVGLQEKLETLVSKLGLTNRIIFLGVRNDVKQIFSASDIGVLSSHQEGFSNAILEAMNVGLPMVVTDVGGNSEAVLNELTGLVVPPRNPFCLARALDLLINDKELREKFGESGKQRVGIKFTLMKCVDGYHELYSKYG